MTDWETFSIALAGVIVFAILGIGPLVMGVPF